MQLFHESSTSCWDRAAGDSLAYGPAVNAASSGRVTIVNSWAGLRAAVSKSEEHTIIQLSGSLQVDAALQIVDVKGLSFRGPAEVECNAAGKTAMVVTR